MTGNMWVCFLCYLTRVNWGFFYSPDFAAKTKKHSYKTETTEGSSCWNVENKTWVIRLSSVWTPECLHMGEWETSIPTWDMRDPTVVLSTSSGQRAAWGAANGGAIPLIKLYVNACRVLGGLGLVHSLKICVELRHWTVPISTTQTHTESESRNLRQLLKI